MEHHYIVRVVEMFSQAGHVQTCQPVSAVDGLLLSVCPVHAVLNEKRKTADKLEGTEVKEEGHQSSRRPAKLHTLPGTGL